MFKINYIKTLHYNWKFFGFNGLKKLPIIVHNRVVFRDTTGRILYSGELRRGCIRFGSKSPLATRDMRFDRTIIDISGDLRLNGPVHIAPGSRISIDNGATLTIGSDFNSTGNLTIICHRDIEIGNDCLFSWDVQIMDTDCHNITDKDGAVVINPPKPVKIGNKVWIGCKVCVFKGSRIPDGCVVGGASTITKPFREPNCIIGGNGFNCKILKRGIEWKA